MPTRSTRPEETDRYRSAGLTTRAATERSDATKPGRPPARSSPADLSPSSPHFESPAPNLTPRNHSGSTCDNSVYCPTTSVTYHLPCFMRFPPSVACCSGCFLPSNPSSAWRNGYSKLAWPDATRLAATQRLIILRFMALEPEAKPDAIREELHPLVRCSVQAIVEPARRPRSRGRPVRAPATVAAGSGATGKSACRPACSGGPVPSLSPASHALSVPFDRLPSERKMVNPYLPLE